MYLRLGADGEAEEEDPGGGDAGLNRVRYRYRLLLHVFGLEHDLRISPIRRGCNGTRADIRPRQRPEAREGRSAGCVRRPQRRGTAGYVASGKRG